MNSQNLIWLIVVVVVLVGGYVVFSSAGSPESSAQPNITQETSTQTDEGTMEKETTTEDAMSGTVPMDDTATMDEKEMKDSTAVKGTYETYSPQKLSNANSGDVVLFFKASWCPSCRALESDIQKNINSIPEGVTILYLNYDTETELKKKYSVTSQHTLVQVDSEGNMIKKWTGSPSLEKVLQEL